MYRTVAQLDQVGSFLSTWFPAFFTRRRLPEPSVEGRPVYALRLRAGGGEGRRGVLLVGGTHARELMNPDAVVELAVDLFVSYVLGNDLTYGDRTWTAREVRLVLDTLDLWMVPCANPDGREHVMTADDMWRKNRRDNPGSDCDGVDLNRNADVLWGVTEGQTSCSPCSDVYCGPSAFSEPESRNVRSLLDTERIDCFADVHSYSELVLYPWGHAPTQTVDPSSRFTSLPTGTCAPIGRRGYQEYMPPRDLQRFQTVAQRIVDAIAGVRGHSYSPQFGLGLYATTGTQSDYAYARHIADPRLRKTYGYTFETGPYVGSVPDSFHPADPTEVKREAKAGMLALAQQCICAIELIGARFLGGEGSVARLRAVRDDLLATTEAGRAWIALFERVQHPLLTLVMDDRELAETAGRLVEAAVRLVEDDATTLTRDDLEPAVAFVRALADRVGDDDVRADLDAVAGAAEASVGLTVREAIERLMERGPGGEEQGLS